MRQQIYNALFKESKEVELSKMEVELGILDEIRNLVKDSLFQRDQVVFILNDMNKKLKSEAKDGLSVTNQALKLISEFKTKAKDLGVDIPKFINSAEQQMNERKKDFEKYI